MAFPIAIGLLYSAIWIGYKIKISIGLSDLNDITNTYLSNPRCGFWVAERVGHQDLSNDVHIVKETDSAIEVERFIGGQRNGHIVGFIGILIKDVTNEPPESVAALKRMAVCKAARRKGIGSALVDVALEHCAKANYRAIELVTTEHHQAARSLYASKGFELIEKNKKNYLEGLISLNLYRLRLSAVHLTRSNLNA